MLRLSRTTPRGASAPRMVEIPVVAGASAPSSGSRSKGTPAAIDGDDASPRDPAPTTRDDAPAVVDPTGAGAERAGGAGAREGREARFRPRSTITATLADLESSPPIHRA